MKKILLFLFAILILFAIPSSEAQAPSDVSCSQLSLQGVGNNFMRVGVTVNPVSPAPASSCGAGTAYWSIPSGDSFFLVCLQAGGGQPLTPPVPDTIEMRLVIDDNNFASDTPSAIWATTFTGAQCNGNPNALTVYCTDNGQSNGSPRYGIIRIFIRAISTDVAQPYDITSEEANGEYGIYRCEEPNVTLVESNPKDPYVGGDSIGVTLTASSDSYESDSSSVNILCDSDTYSLSSSATAGATPQTFSEVIKGSSVYASYCSLSGEWSSTKKSALTGYTDKEWNVIGSLSVEFAGTVQRSASQSASCDFDIPTVNRGQTRTFTCSYTNARGETLSGNFRYFLTDTGDMENPSDNGVFTIPNDMDTGYHFILAHHYGGLSRTDANLMNWGYEGDGYADEWTDKIGGITLDPDSKGSAINSGSLSVPITATKGPVGVFSTSNLDAYTVSAKVNFNGGHFKGNIYDTNTHDWRLSGSESVPSLAELLFHFQGGVSPTPRVTGLSTGSWVHYLTTTDDITGTQKLYVDGVEVYSGSYGGDVIAFLTPITLGSPSSNAVVRPCDCLIDNFTIWGRAINPSEISLSVSGGPPNDALAYWDFEERAQAKALWVSDIYYFDSILNSKSPSPSNTNASKFTIGADEQYVTPGPLRDFTGDLVVDAAVTCEQRGPTYPAISASVIDHGSTSNQGESSEVQYDIKTPQGGWAIVCFGLQEGNTGEYKIEFFYNSALASDVKIAIIPSLVQEGSTPYLFVIATVNVHDLGLGYVQKSSNDSDSPVRITIDNGSYRFLDGLIMEESEENNIFTASILLNDSLLNASVLNLLLTTNISGKPFIESEIFSTGGEVVTMSSGLPEAVSISVAVMALLLSGVGVSFFSKTNPVAPGIGMIASLVAWGITIDYGSDIVLTLACVSCLFVCGLRTYLIGFSKDNPEAISDRE